MKTLLTVLIVVTVWIALIKFVFPKLGIKG